MKAVQMMTPVPLRQEQDQHHRPIKQRPRDLQMLRREEDPAKGRPVDEGRTDDREEDSKEGPDEDDTTRTNEKASRPVSVPEKTRASQEGDDMQIEVVLSEIDSVAASRTVFRNRQVVLPTKTAAE